MTKLRTTFTPDRVIEVGDGEFVDLQRQGLIHSHEPIEKESYLGTTLASVATPNRWKDGKADDAQTGDLSTNAGTDDKKGA